MHLVVTVDIHCHTSKEINRNPKVKIRDLYNYLVFCFVSSVFAIDQRLLLDLTVSESSTHRSGVVKVARPTREVSLSESSLTRDPWPTRLKAGSVKSREMKWTDSIPGTFLRWWVQVTRNQKLGQVTSNSRGSFILRNWRLFCEGALFRMVSLHDLQLIKGLFVGWLYLKTPGTGISRNKLTGKLPGNKRKLLPQLPSVFGSLAPMSVSEGCLETKTPPISPNSWFT